MSTVRTAARAVLLSLIVTLVGCASHGDAILQTMKIAVERNIDPSDVKGQLNPNFRYLRITIAGHATLVVLGYVDTDPQGPIEVWLSADREVLRLQNGRLIGAIGLATEWRSVILPRLPKWSEIARSQEPLRWMRLRDVMPGYHFGLRDSMILRVISPPPKSALQGIDAGSLTWFEEQTEPTSSAGLLTIIGIARPKEPLPPARYAVDLHTPQESVVYSEQCLSERLCFTWQHWRP